MKIKKHFFKFLTLILICCTFLASGCFGLGKKVSYIEIINSSEPYYEITYTDGSTEIVPINQSNIAETLYQEYKTLYPDATYEDFLRKFIIDADSLMINEILPTSARVKVYKGLSTVSTGSAVIYKIENDYTYFITNYHVVCGANGTVSSSYEFSCSLYGNQEEYFSCEYVGGSINYDLAILRASTNTVKSYDQNAKEIVFAEQYYVGDTAVAIGNPNNEGISVTKGIVSVDSEDIVIELGGTEVSMRLLRMDTAIYSGNSGGGVFNAQGKLIGIASAGSIENERINYAIPLDIVKNVVENLMYYCKDTTSTNGKVLSHALSVKTNSQSYVKENGYNVLTESVYVSGFNSWYFQKFSLYNGYRILSITIDETEYVVNRGFDIDTALLNVREGSKIKFKYSSNGTEKDSKEYTLKSSDLKTLE